MKRTLKKKILKYQGGGNLYQNPLEYKSPFANMSGNNVAPPVDNGVYGNSIENISPQFLTFEDWQKQSAGQLGVTPNFDIQSNDTTLQINPNQIVQGNTQKQTPREVLQPVSSLVPTGTTFGTPGEMLKSNAELNVNKFQSENDTKPITDYNYGNNIQFFNPYGGADLEGSASMLGSSIEDKNPLGIVGAGLKLATSLGRNFLGGMGIQRRNNQVMKDYYQKQRDGLTKEVVAEEGGYFQDGGNVDSNYERDSIAPQKPIKHIQKVSTNEYKDHNQLPPGSYYKVYYTDPNKAKIENQDYEYVDESGYGGLQKMNNYRIYMNSMRGNNSIASFQDGGKMDLPKALVGDFTTGMDKENPIQEPNAELEAGEHLQHPGGDVQKVIGNTHEDGGEDMHLEEGTKILSDHLKIGGALARELRKDYDLDLKATDTYAKVLDKYTKKIGLNKISEEQELIIKELDKQNKEVKDEETLGLNVQHLSGKLNDLEKKKLPLEEIKKKMFEDLFNEQEESKPEKKEDSTEDIFQEGGLIDSLSKKHGVSLDRAKEILKYQDGGGYTEKQRRDRFKDFYNQSKNLGYEGDANPNSKDLNPEAGKLQTWMAKNHPEVVAAYTKGVDMTAKGVDIIKQRNPEIFTKTGVSSSKPSASYTSQEKELLKGQLEQAGLATDDFWKEQFQDNKWTFRYPQVPMGNNLKQAPGTNDMQAPSYQPTNSEIPADINLNTVDNVSVYNRSEKNVDGNRLNFLLLPDQSPMMPGSLQPHLKINRRFDRVNPALISPEQNIVETNRNRNAVFNEINNVPGAQRVAALTSVSANTDENLNKVITNANQINSQAIARADSQNATIQAVEENAGAQDALSYEQRQLTAVAKTDNDINNYYNKLRENNARNYNEINNLNAVNAMNDHYQFDGQGYVQVDRPQFFVNNRLPETDAQKLARLEVERKQLKSNIKKAKFGGRFKK